MEINNENRSWAAGKIKRLTMLPYAPTLPEGIVASAERLLAMLPSREIGDWLIEELEKHEERFPTPLRMREVLKHKHRPADDPKRPGEEGYVGTWY